MARHGENIRKRKDGRWEGRYLIHNPEQNRKKYCSVYGKSYGEVKEKLFLCKSQQNHPSSLVKEQVWQTIPFADMAEEWLSYIKQSRKHSTFVKYDLVYRIHIAPGFQDMNLSQITSSNVRKKISDPSSESIEKSIYCVLNQILKYVSIKYSVPLQVLNRPVSSVRNKPVEVLSRSEQKKLLSVICQKGDCFKTAVLLCMHTGLRLGELCGLKWEDIDLENQLLTVNRTVQRLPMEGRSAKTILLETTPKSEHSHRQIPLSVKLFQLLISLKTRRDKKIYIFGGDQPLEPRTLQNHFKKILKEAGLKNKNFHILRHTFATNCIEGGADVKSLSEILGHSDVRISLNKYVHPSIDTKRKHLDMLFGFYGQIYGHTG